MAELFQQTVANINTHLGRIYSEKELEKDSTIKESLIVQTEGNRRISRKLTLYNLDVIISVGYRVRSRQGTQFRIWATHVLRDHLIKGYTLNKKALDRTTAGIVELQRTINIITSVRNKKLTSDEAQGLLTIIKNKDLHLSVSLFP